MLVHIRKLLYDYNSSSIPPPLLAQPPSTSTNADAGSKQFHDLSPFLIPLFLALGAAFLVVSYFTVGRKYYLSSTNRTRTTSRNLDDDRNNFVDEHHGPWMDNHVWLINTIGLEQSVIDSISVFKYKKNEGLVEGAVCLICLSEFEGDETLRLLPKCSHAFHMTCIDMWLRSHQNCPTCRAPIVSETITQVNESVSNSNNVRPTGETSDDRLSNFCEVEGHRQGHEAGAISANFVELPKEKERSEETATRKLTCVDTKSRDIQTLNDNNSCSRVLSDLSGYIQKVEAESGPMKRSTSLDMFSTSRVCRAMANIHETEVEGCSSTPLVHANSMKSEKSDKGLDVNLMISKIMKSSSLRFSLRKGPISMKRSSSLGGS